MHTPWFFKRLGIEPTDDSKVIRRAYAIELKKIDQETQADEFETLRQAYELAREWQNRRHLDQAPTLQTEAAQSAAPLATKSQANEVKVNYSEAENPALADVEPQTAPPATVKVSYADQPPHKTKEVKPSQGTVEVSYATTQSTEKEQATQSQSTSAQAFDIELYFKEFVEQIKTNPQNAKTRFLVLMNSEAMISLDARMQFELKLAAWLHKNPYPYAELFEAAIEQFHWHEQLPNHHDYRVNQWLRQVMDQWLQWQTTDATWRKQVFSAIYKNSWLVSLNEQGAFSIACSRYPLFMRFWVNEDRINGVTAKKATWKPIATFCVCMLIFAAICFGAGTLLIESADDNRQQKKTVVPVSAEIKELRKKTIEAIKKQEQRKQALEKQKLERQQAQRDKLAAKFTPTESKPISKPTTPKPVVLAKKEVSKPELNPNVVSFKMSPQLCKARVELIGRWGALYKNQTNYQSFENEAITCINKGWWPKGNTTPQEYLSRLQAAWLKPNADNVSLEGLELEARNRHQDPKHDLMMMCDRERRVNPFQFPIGAGCVALAATYQPPKINTFKVSPELCQQRSQTPNWHFDQGLEWNNYLSYKQEVLDCVVNGWWPDRNHKRYINELKQAWQQTKK